MINELIHIRGIKDTAHSQAIKTILALHRMACISATSFQHRDTLQQPSEISEPTVQLLKKLSYSDLHDLPDHSDTLFSDSPSNQIE